MSQVHERTGGRGVEDYLALPLPAYMTSTFTLDLPLAKNVDITYSSLRKHVGIRVHDLTEQD